MSFAAAFCAEALADFFNIANLTYAASAGNLYSSGFGQPNLGKEFSSVFPQKSAKDAANATAKSLPKRIFRTVVLGCC